MLIYNLALINSTVKNYLLIILLILATTSCGKSKEEIETQRGLEAIVRQLNTKANFYNQNIMLSEQNSGFLKLYEQYNNIETDFGSLKLKSDELHAGKSLTEDKDKIDEILDSLVNSIIERKKILIEVKNLSDDISSMSIETVYDEFEKTKRQAYQYQERVNYLNTLIDHTNKTLEESKFTDTLEIDPSFNFDWLVGMLGRLDSIITEAVESDKLLKDIRRKRELERQKEDSLRQQQREARLAEKERIRQEQLKANAKEAQRVKEINDYNRKEFNKNKEEGRFDFKTLYKNDSYISVIDYSDNYGEGWKIEQNGRNNALSWSTMQDAIGRSLAVELSEYYLKRNLEIVKNKNIENIKSYSAEPTIALFDIRDGRVGNKITAEITFNPIHNLYRIKLIDFVHSLKESIGNSAHEELINKLDSELGRKFSEYQNKISEDEKRNIQNAKSVLEGKTGLLIFHYNSYRFNCYEKFGSSMRKVSTGLPPEHNKLEVVKLAKLGSTTYLFFNYKRYKYYIPISEVYNSELAKELTAKMGTEKL